VPLVSISDAQRKPVAWANFIATVHHGIHLDEFAFNPRKAGLSLKIAARMPLPFREDPSVRADWEYWEATIKPLLGSDVEMIGELGGARKAAFLRDAAALLFPVRWPEPFGLVMVEALACGTPVLALRYGSVPEVIRDGVTGFVRDSEEGLIRAVELLASIDRASCRAEAEQRFSSSAMVNA
jgi:glycosyltransferase involved in cell wall biosynthesis